MTTRAHRLAWLILAVVPLFCVTLAASAAWHVLAAHHARVVGPVTLPAATAQEVSDLRNRIVVTAASPLPTAPLPLPAGEHAAPAPGTTGTAPLPMLPIPAMAPDPLDATVRPAQPFSTARATALDRGRAIECLTAAIYYEAASESDAGQRAVAQVVLNRVRHPAFPNTVCGVVYQGSERAGCQFSFACDGSMARVPMRSAWARAMRIASDALAGLVFAPVGLATHYHTYAVTPAWNRALVMTDAIGAHFFHRWKGFWGTAAAFSQHYAGGEPMPGPHPRLVAPTLPSLVLAANTPAPVAPTTAPAALQPAYADSGTPLTAAPTGDVPGSSQVLDRWKDSGKPLR